MAIRPARFRQSFFDDLDAQLPAERTDDGRPAAIDVLLFDLPRLRDLLANGYEHNTQPVRGAEPVRVLIQAGTLVHSAAPYAIETPDRTIDVIAIDLDASAADDG